MRSSKNPNRPKHDPPSDADEDISTHPPTADYSASESDPIPTADIATTMSLAEVLRSLGLGHAAQNLDAATQKAITRNDSPTALIDHLMRDELRAQLESRARAALKRSCIFPLTTLDTYDFNYPKFIDRALVARAATLDFIRDKSNCVLIGPSGVGKTHIANAIGQLACLRGHRVRFIVAADLVNDLVTAQARGTLQRRLAVWAAPQLLLIDELGYLALDAKQADLLYQVFNRRYQRTSTIVTTNLAFKDWGTLFQNAAAASAIADRLVHKGILLKITGKSKRSDEEVA